MWNSRGVILTYQPTICQEELQKPMKTSVRIDDLWAEI
jgi:hypothetical protein